MFCYSMIFCHLLHYESISSIVRHVIHQLFWWLCLPIDIHYHLLSIHLFICYQYLFHVCIDQVIKFWYLHLVNHKIMLRNNFRHSIFCAFKHIQNFYLFTALHHEESSLRIYWFLLTFEDRKRVIVHQKFNFLFWS